jgi:sulfur-oxidizing protein SoxX
MRTIFGAAAAVLASAGLAGAAEVMPSDVTFMDGMIEASLTGSAGDAEAGRLVMNKGSGNCIACHAVTELEEAFPFHGEVGPPLDGVGDRWTEAELRGIVADAKQMFDGTMMPSFYKTKGYIRPGDGFTGKAGEEPLPPLLTAQQIEDVVAYLMTLKED